MESLSDVPFAVRITCQHARVRRTLAILVSASALACSPRAADRHAASAEVRSRDSVQVVTHVVEMLAAIRARDADRAVSYYDSSGVFVHYENGREVPWKVLEPQMRQFLASAARIDLVWVGTPLVVPLGPDASLVRGVHAFEGVLQDGRTLPRHTGVWTGVFRRADGAWKLIHSHSSEPH